MSDNCVRKNVVLTGTVIKPYARVFALELQQTDILIREKENRLVDLITPSGARISRLLSCGALTEINLTAKGGGYIRVADPTGVLIIYLKTRNPEILTVLHTLSPPVFVSVAATIESYTGTTGDYGFRLVLDAIHPSTRGERDRWILSTGNLTLSRLKRLTEVLASGQGNEDKLKAIHRYKTSHRQLKVLAGMIEKALNQVQNLPEGENGKSETTAPEKPDDVVNQVLQLIRQHSGPRGVAVSELAVFAQKADIAEPLLLDTIRVLIADDEIYQPSSGFVKIL